MFTSAKDMLLYALFCAVIPYLLGSLSFSIIVSRLLFQKDVRDYGSHNAGMTNVLRTFGKGAAALTVVGDIGKGVAAVLLAKWCFSAGLSNAAALGGAVIGVMPGLFGVCAFAPPLDDAGNSVKAQAALKHLMKSLNLNVFSNTHFDLVEA